MAGDSSRGGPTAIIFDFDGTIADSFQAVVGELYKAVHHETVESGEIEQLRYQSLLQTLRTLRISWWRALLVARDVRTRMVSDMGSINAVQGIPEVVQTLASTYTLFILSSNDERNVRKFLELHALTDYFADIYGDADPLNKSRALHRLVEAKRLTTAAAWYVGDQPWDVRAAHRAGLRAAAVTWGYSNSTNLKRQHPEALVSQPQELITLFAKQ